MIRLTRERGRAPAALMLAGLLLAAAPGVARAQGATIVVPDDYPTIQQAVEVQDAAVVIVRAGHWAERVTIDRPEEWGNFTLRGFPGEPRPRIDALFVYHRRPTTIESLDVAGGVYLDTRDSFIGLSFADCRLDSGVVHVRAMDTYDLSPLSFQRCRITGDVRAQTNIALFTADTLLGGTVVVGTETGGATFTDCWFQGPGAVAIQTGGDWMGTRVMRCRIEGYRSGIHTGVGEGSTLVAEDNTIVGAADFGIRALGGGVVVRRNVVRNGGFGIAAYGEASVSIEDNVVLGMTRSGISANSGGSISRNVVGRCGGNGIEAAGRSDEGGFEVRGNTVWGSGGNGIRIDNCCGESGQVAANIAYRNTGFGISIETTPGVPHDIQFSCNDAYDNVAGPGVVSPTDVAVDPEFCDIDRDDVHLAATSPLLALPGCGPVGALGRGCEIPSGERVTTIGVTPCDPGGWSGGAGAVLGSRYGAPGSLELSGDGATRVAYGVANPSSDLLRDLSALEIAALRDGGTAPTDRVPVVRLHVDDGAGTRSWLIWEAWRNGYGTAPQGMWNPYGLLHGRFWQRVGEGAAERTIDLYERTLADWLLPGTVTDGDGDVSAPIGPEARVIGWEIGLEADGQGSIDAAADDFLIGFREARRRYAFDVLRPTTLTLIAPTAAPCTAPLLLSAAIVSGDMAGIVDFWEGERLLGSVPLESPGVARLEIGTRAVGAHGFRAAYRGAPCIAPSEAVASTQVHAVPTELTMTSLLNEVAFGDSLAFPFWIQPTSATGMVDLWEDGRLVGSAPVVLEGAGVLRVNVTGLGHHALLATYRGDGCHAPDSSAYAHVTIEGPPEIHLFFQDVDEGDSGEVVLLDVPLRLSSPSGRTTTVAYRTEAGTATAGVDYEAASGVVVFPPYEILQSILIRVVGDDVPEAPESIRVLLSAPVNATLRDSVTSVVIADDDRTIARFAGGTTAGMEGTGGMSAFAFSVELQEAARETVTVTYGTADGTALAGRDYAPVTGTLAFAPGELTKHFEVPVFADTNFEGNEQFSVLLDAGMPDRVVVETPVFGVTIQNDDVMPGMSIEGASGFEGDLGGYDTLQFRVVLSGANEVSPVRASYVMRDGTAKSPADFTAGSGSVFFPVGAREAWIRARVRGDFDCEPSETFSVSLFSPQGATLRVLSASGTIQNDDDCNTPTEVSLLRATATPEGIEVRFQFADAAAIASVVIERAPGEEGPWTRVAAEIREADGITVALDRGVSAGTHWYRVVTRDLDGAEAVYGPVAATSEVTAFALGRIAPNPARAAVTIEFAVARASAVRLAILDVQGREVATLASGVHEPGAYVARWNAEDARGRVPAGLYFVRYQAAGKTWTRRLVITR